MEYELYEETERNNEATDEEGPISGDMEGKGASEVLVRSGYRHSLPWNVNCLFKTLGAVPFLAKYNC
ncbi:hypothetical protein L1887_18407 [Cichorium endivia]|nr:hypothetical protein L1887_18407 [Cichorium endivia]